MIVFSDLTAGLSSRMAPQLSHLYSVLLFQGNEVVCWCVQPFVCWILHHNRIFVITNVRIMAIKPKPYEVSICIVVGFCCEFSSLAMNYRQEGSISLHSLASFQNWRKYHCFV